MYVCFSGGFSFFSGGLQWFMVWFLAAFLWWSGDVSNIDFSMTSRGLFHQVAKSITGHAIFLWLSQSFMG